MKKKYLVIFFSKLLILQQIEAFPDWLIEDIGIKSRLRILPNKVSVSIYVDWNN